ncbi:MAG: BCCT family transporter [Butyricicoccus sp.]|nr:BCCT family transporter [Butyricicoccus sp.]
MEKKTNPLSLINKRIFIPGVAVLLAYILAGVVFPEGFMSTVNTIQNFFSGAFKWVYILCGVLTSVICIFVLFSKKYGSIRFGGPNAKASVKTLHWVTISLTGSIAIGICFFGVAGPVNFFTNPPAFLGIEAGSPDAMIPAIIFSFLHYCLPPYFIVCFCGFILGLVSYNSKQPFTASATLYPILGKKAYGFVGDLVNLLFFLSLVIVGTNMGLSVIQINAGIGSITGNSQLDVQMVIIVVYVIATIIFACSGVHGTMGKLSNVNAVMYVIIIGFVLFAGPTSRLLCTAIEATGSFVGNYVPLVCFGDVALNTDWQTGNTLFYYSWNAMPGLLPAFFYASMAYGRTLKEFVIVHCLVPSIFLVCWYSFIGGSAIISVMEGSNLPQVIAEQGSGIATFAFLDTLPGGTFWKWFFIIMALITFVTWADSIAFSFPMMFMKETAEDKTKTKTPKIFIAGTAIFMGLLTFTLVFVGGYDAMDASIVCWGLPACALICVLVISAFKFLFNRKKYDLAYAEEFAKEEAIAAAAEALVANSAAQN